MSQTERVPTNLRLLRIVDRMAEAGRPLSPSEINASIGLPKASIHRLCQTLIDEGYVVRDTDPKKLCLSRRMRVTASRILDTDHLRIGRHQELQRLAAQLRETVNFVVPEEAGMRYLDRVEADWPLRVQLPIGTHVPFHCTASGKCFLAHLAHRPLGRLLSALDLSPRTEATLADVPSLKAELKRIRSRGYATDREEFIEGMMAVAVPVIGPDGQFLGALAAHGPASRLGPDRFDVIARDLTEGAARVAEQLL
ncbi:MAG: IclR family transcriptional regulator [Pseudomonadota bacterium]